MLISPADQLARGVSALTRGEPIAIAAADAGAVVVSIETVTDARLKSLSEAFGPPPSAAVTRRRAETLRAPVYDDDVARIALRPDATVSEIRAIADPTRALETPLAGPHRALRDGGAELERRAVSLCRNARLLPAALVWPLEDAGHAGEMADAHDLLIVADVALALHAAGPPPLWREVVNARVPIAAQSNTRLRLMRRVGGEDEHYAVEVGEVSRDAPVLARLHSACATGDIFGSLKCDCGPQLAAALKQMGEEGGGFLIYLLQEGRGIGLANKLRAYRLQEDGFDTVEANHRLGFNDDERLLADGGQILRALGVGSVRLMTNNPAKLSAVEAAGVRIVDRVPLRVGINGHNVEYLKTKVAKSGHLF